MIMFDASACLLTDSILEAHCATGDRHARHWTGSAGPCQYRNRKFRPSLFPNVPFHHSEVSDIRARPQRFWGWKYQAVRHTVYLSSSVYISVRCTVLCRKGAHEDYIYAEPFGQHHSLNSLPHSTRALAQLYIYIYIADSMGRKLATIERKLPWSRIPACWGILSPL